MNYTDAILDVKGIRGIQAVEYPQDLEAIYIFIQVFTIDESKMSYRVQKIYTSNIFKSLKPYPDKINHTEIIEKQLIPTHEGAKGVNLTVKLFESGRVF